jgi:hypothetical protein
MNTKWITDRLPREEDGSIWLTGQVWISGVDGVYTTHWSEANKDQPWQPILAPAPYVKPKMWTKRWTVKRNNHHDEWYLYDGEKEWDRLDGRLTQDAAQRICDIYNEVMP